MLCAKSALLAYSLMLQVALEPVDVEKSLILHPPKGVTGNPKLEKIGIYEYPLNLERFNIVWPPIGDDLLKKILSHRKATPYKLPKVYQFSRPKKSAAHYSEVAGKKFEVDQEVFVVLPTSYLKPLNANEDFPWEITVGMNGVDHKGQFIFNILCPFDDEVAVLDKEEPVYWIFPPDAVVSEIITIQDVANGDDKRYIQEIRGRQKVLSDGGYTWVPLVYRTTKDRDDFIKKAGIKDYEPAKKYMFFRNPEEDQVAKMEGFVERLPDIPPDTVKKILSEYPLVDVTDNGWHPSSDIDFHIVPKDYSFHLVGTVNNAGVAGFPDETVCAQCHRQTHIGVHNLIPREPLIQKYFISVGNIRGSDAVFTYYPFKMREDFFVKGKSLFTLQEMKARTIYREYDIENHIISAYDPVRHPKHKLTQYVVEALKDYERPKERSVYYVHPDDRESLKVEIPQKESNDIQREQK